MAKYVNLRHIRLMIYELMVFAKTSIVSHRQTFDLHLRLVLIAKTEWDCLSDTKNNKSTEKFSLEIYLEQRFEFYRLQSKKKNLDLLLLLLLLNNYIFYFIIIQLNKVIDTN